MRKPWVTMFLIRALVFCSLAGLATFYGFTLIYLPLTSIDFIEKARLKALLGGTRYEAGQRITIAQRNHFIRGWSTAEPTGVWSSGHRSSVAVSVGRRPDRDLQLEVLAMAFVKAPGHQQEVNVSANRNLIARWSYAYGQGPIEKI